MVRISKILNEKLATYYCADFVTDDPISIPHSYIRQQDIEITAFWTAVLSWGRRTTIITKARELFDLMGSSPHEFVLNHSESDRRRFANFKHRTFQYTDTLQFLNFLQLHYREFNSLEDAFLYESGNGMIDRLSNFYDHFCQSLKLSRTKKHIASPQKNASCKRLNMFLRWMVRKDNRGVDFGLWNRIPMSELMLPLDVHVERAGRHLGMITRKQRDWKAVEELTHHCRQLDREDPCKYDFALFGYGMELAN